MTAGIYRKPSGNAPNAWPAYWDGRWFLSDFAGGNNIRHALLMDPATETKGGLPVSADSLYGDHPDQPVGANRTIDLDFGPDGALYVASYSGSNFTISNANTGVWRSPTSAATTLRVRTRRPRRRRRAWSNVQHRQVRWRLLRVDLRRRRQADGRPPATRTYRRPAARPR